MKITLKDIMNEQLWGQTILEVKQTLINYKKKGQIFFEESISQLEQQNTFEIYYFGRSNEKSTINAFPIPIQEFRLFNNQKENRKFINGYFTKYYGIDKNDERVQPSNYKLFVGTDFVWLYSNTI
ncbi:hypothetical protein [Paenibacillus sp. BC26]|uniref:hypothetical protein n=1 Tax=Paenibacillus sp. BC26 TaxID=1881032 RepID=UPI0008EE1336|nr:hypothetical protein [Paenibacillus sp. BC26]SFS75865.1 hypothetical protein SAMN05428962_2680 [Paenibacillus sp. BC26]